MAQFLFNFQGNTKNLVAKEENEVFGFAFVYLSLDKFQFQSD
jgi:hypothetical protein